MSPGKSAQMNGIRAESETCHSTPVRPATTINEVTAALSRLLALRHTALMLDTSTPFFCPLRGAGPCTASASRRQPTPRNPLIH
jgi:hypothetical protein